MIIRKAENKDLNEVKGLLDLSSVKRSQEEWERETCGIFEYTKSLGELRNSLNPFFTIAQNSQRLVGFNLAYDSSFLEKFFSDSNLVSYQYLLNKNEGEFIYADILATLNPATMSSGIVANLLFDDMAKKSRNSGIDKIVAFVPLHPFLNKRSRDFALRKGFKNIDELPIEDGIVLGYYELDLVH
jgi:hypothetical protein